jgi:hypothetical protein
MTRCEAEEVARRRYIVAAKTTDRARWSDPASYEPFWSDRAATAGRLCDNASWVCDIGCGPIQSLQRFLPAATVYLPADLCAWTPRVCICDLNAPILPERYLRLSNIVYLLGVIEYIQDLLRLFTALASRTETIVVSYNCTNLGEADRSGYGWVNALASEDVLALLGDTGFHPVAIERVGTMEIVVKAENVNFGLSWRLRRRAARLVAG